MDLQYKQQRSFVLGIALDTVSQKEAHHIAEDFLYSSVSKKIFTPNPEMIVKAKNDTYFAQVLNSADLSLCDGFGLWAAARFLHHPVHRIAGVDFMLDVCELASKKNASIFLLGSASDAVAQKTATQLKARFPSLAVLGAEKGPVFEEGSEMDFELTIKRINDAKPDILFVAFGMGKQEKWIHQNIDKMPSVKIAMGVGGAFDFISGGVSRAPLLLRKIGLEWLYRLIREPRRLGRIFNATIRFFWIFLTDH